MKMEDYIFGYQDNGASCAHEYLLPRFLEKLHGITKGKLLRILDLGCCNEYEIQKVKAGWLVNLERSAFRQTLIEALGDKRERVVREPREGN
jgi:hypothetical protein